MSRRNKLWIGALAVLLLAEVILALGSRPGVTFDAQRYTYTAEGTPTITIHPDGRIELSEPEAPKPEMPAGMQGLLDAMVYIYIVVLILGSVAWMAKEGTT